MDISLNTVLNTEEGQVAFDLTAWAGVYNLTTAVFKGQVRDYYGSLVVRYEWLTGGSSFTPNSIINWNDTTKILSLYAPSKDMVSIFAPSVVAATNGAFVWELGFYIASRPDDYIGLGNGAFPVANGVVL